MTDTDTTDLAYQARLRASRKCADGYAVPFDVNLDNALADAIERLTRERDAALDRLLPKGWRKLGHDESGKFVGIEPYCQECRLSPRVGICCICGRPAPPQPDAEC